MYECRRLVVSHLEAPLLPSGDFQSHVQAHACPEPELPEVWRCIDLALQRKVYAKSYEVWHQAQHAPFLITRVTMSQWITEKSLVTRVHQVRALLRRGRQIWPPLQDA